MWIRTVKGGMVNSNHVAMISPAEESTTEKGRFLVTAHVNAGLTGNIVFLFKGTKEEADTYREDLYAKLLKDG